MQSAYLNKNISELLTLRVVLMCFICSLLISCISLDQHNISNIKERPSVKAVFPSSDTLPENLLRFYVLFSKPMKAINNLENIKLLDENGNEIRGAIFNNVYELWDRDQKQLTLILDPARVKTGLITHESMGRALKPYESFKLVIETAEDIHGTEINHPFVKEFFVSKADTIIPNYINWKITSPLSSTTSPLIIDFPQPLDRQSLLTRLSLLDENHQLISGRIELQKDEKRWTMTPSENWTKGIYSIVVNSRLEDPAGNNMNGKFDHEIGSLINADEGEIKTIRFSIE